MKTFKFLWSYAIKYKGSLLLTVFSMMMLVIVQLFAPWIVREIKAFVQEERIAIARALLSDKPILILDEATSAVDTETEKLIQEALEHVMDGRTTVIVAHRLSTIRKADIIVVLDEGGIAESGTHDDLVALGGIYHKLHEVYA